MVPWDVCIMPKDEGGLGLIDVATQGYILEAKWVVRCLENTSPWQVLLRHRLLSAQHVGKIKGQFGLCDILFLPHNFQIAGSFIFRSIWAAWRKVASLVHWQMSGSELGGTWPKGDLELEAGRHLCL
jgi:hypothetical protein